MCLIKNKKQWEIGRLICTVHNTSKTYEFLRVYLFNSYLLPDICNEVKFKFSETATKIWIYLQLRFDITYCGVLGKPKLYIHI